MKSSKFVFVDDDKSEDEYELASLDAQTFTIHDADNSKTEGVLN